MKAHIIYYNMSNNCERLVGWAATCQHCQFNVIKIELSCTHRSSPKYEASVDNWITFPSHFQSAFIEKVM